MPDEKCPKCGAGVSREIGVLLRYECGSGSDKGTLYQSDACTIAALTQQLADAEDAMRALACSLSAGGYNATDFDPKLFYDKINWGINEMVQREIRLEQQLADARLLARAANAGVIMWDVIAGMNIRKNGKPVSWHDTRHDPDGLPILTPELRAALEKAVGEE